MARSEFPSKVRVAAFKRSGGRCEECTARLLPGKFQYDHVLADGLSGEPTLENCRVLCTCCHSEKTHRHDRPRITKANKQRKAHIGAKQTSRPMPGSRASGWKHNMDGTWERR